MATLQHVVRRNESIQLLVASLERELRDLRASVVKRKKLQLVEENELLRKKVEDTKQQLIALMLRNGKCVVPVPGLRTLCSIASESCISRETDNQAAGRKSSTPLVSSKSKKPASFTKPTAEQHVDISRLDLRVGKILEVSRHPDADSLYVEKIDCGEKQPRTVVSGLLKHVPIEEMQGRSVIVLCNLKPVKMRGIISEAMVMCASYSEKVEILKPPVDAVPGDPIFCEEYNRQPDPELNPKKKVFESIAPDLMTNDAKVATYKGRALFVSGKGVITAPSLCSAHIK